MLFKEDFKNYEEDIGDDEELGTEEEFTLGLLLHLPNFRSLICHMAFKLLLGLARGHFGHFLVKNGCFLAKIATKPKMLLAYSKPTQMC